MTLLHSEAENLDVASVLSQFTRDGYAKLGRVASDKALESLRQRAQDIMAGHRSYPGLFFQKDTESGKYEDLEYGKGWQGPSDNYRKIEKLEKDEVFLSWIENSLFERIARAHIDGDIAIYRAILMTKRAKGGTLLPWHQDGGRMWGLSRDPEIQIWTALDDAPREAGCVEVFPGSHRHGLVTPLGGVVPNECVLERSPELHSVMLPARAGEAILLHNYVWHRSGTNGTQNPRRALSVAYMSASTLCLRKKRTPRTFFRVFASKRPDEGR